MADWPVDIDDRGVTVMILVAAFPRLVAGMLVVLLLLTGCVATGVRYMDNVASQASPGPGQSRIIVFRTDDSAVYLLREARIQLDGLTRGSVRIGEYLLYDLQPGEHTLRADMWDSPGACLLKLRLEPGQVMYFRVDPREASFWFFAAPAFATELALDALTLSLATGMLVTSAESYGKECGGAFRLYPVDTGSAHLQLLEMRQATQ